MIRSETIIIYQGKERIYFGYKDGMFIVFEDYYNDPEKRKFKVPIEKVETVYGTIPYCIYKGYKFCVEGAHDGKICLFTGDDDLRDKFGFYVRTNADYLKLVDMSEISDLHEEKSPMFGFSAESIKPYEHINAKCDL